MKQKPNIIFIYADDLGRGMLSCYGQRYFRTPHIDSLANSGIRFTHSYGCVFCAPARASLLSGKHDCHQGTWTFTYGGLYTKLHTNEINMEDLKEIINTTGLQANDKDIFLAEIAREAGYVTGQIGKLEWGFCTTPERIKRHGWDYHFGYYDHIRCHGYYPPYLFEDGRKINIPGNTYMYCGRIPHNESRENHKIQKNKKGRKIYSQDLFNGKIINFLRKNRDKPFFLFHPSQLPHGPISVPEIDNSLKNTDRLTVYEKEYASMVLRLDETVGLIINELKDLGIYDNTVIIFCSDNGHELYYSQEGKTTKLFNIMTGEKFDNYSTKFYSELGGDIFNGNDGMAGLKFTNWEGGARIPYIVSWPGVTTANSVSDHMLANYDVMATLADIFDIKLPDDNDGISFLPSICQANDKQQKHKYIVYASSLGPSLITEDGWKIRSYINKYQLFDIKNDYREKTDLSNDYPEKTKELAELLINACDGNILNGNPQTHRAAYQNESYNNIFKEISEKKLQ